MNQACSLSACDGQEVKDQSLSSVWSPQHPSNVPWRPGAMEDTERVTVSTMEEGSSVIRGGTLPPDSPRFTQDSGWPR